MRKAETLTSELGKAYTTRRYEIQVEQGKPKKSSSFRSRRTPSETGLNSKRSKRVARRSSRGSFRYDGRPFIDYLNPLTYMSHAQYMSLWRVIFQAVLQGFWAKFFASFALFLAFFLGVSRQRIVAGRPSLLPLRRDSLRRMHAEIRAGVMSHKDGDKSNDITPIGVGGSIRPKSFIDVVSIVQNYFLAEKHGNDLPENLLTLKGKIVISEVGFKGAFISGSSAYF